VQALSSAGDFVIPPRRAEIHPRMELQRNKTDKNSVGLLARLMRSGRFEPVHAQGRASNRVKLLFYHRRTFEMQTDGHRERDLSAAPDVRPDDWSPRPRCKLLEPRQRFGRCRSAASDRVGLNSSAKSDARRCTDGLRTSPPGRYSTMPWFVACKAQSRQHRGEQHREEHDQDGCRAQIMNAPEMPGGVCDFSTLTQQWWRHVCQPRSEVKQDGGKSECVALAFRLLRQFTPTRQ
jgi:hypothetical protein